MSRAYGWTPDQIGQLTLQQALIYSGAKNIDASPVRRFSSVAEAMAYQAAKTQRRGES